MHSKLLKKEQVTTREIGSLRLATIKHTLNGQAAPGQCVKINGRWFAIADQLNDLFTLVISDSSPIINEPCTSIEGPIGAGFKNVGVDSAVVIVGGTGLGAATMLIRRRAIEGKDTYVIVYGKNVAAGRVKNTFPFLTSCKEIVFWDTIKAGRPENPFDPLSHVPDDASVFVAGPKSLVDAVKTAAAARQLQVETNF